MKPGQAQIAPGESGNVTLIGDSSFQGKSLFAWVVGRNPKNDDPAVKNEASRGRYVGGSLASTSDLPTRHASFPFCTSSCRQELLYSTRIVPIAAPGYG